MEQTQVNLIAWILVAGFFVTIFLVGAITVYNAVKRAYASRTAEPQYTRDQLEKIAEEKFVSMQATSAKKV